MPQIIQTNLLSLASQNNLNKTQGALTNTIKRLSSGLRINTAKDDAAGLAISERITAQIRGMTVAARNASDGISLGQTAESALVEITNATQRIRELAVQSANGTNGTGERQSLNKEVVQLQAEIKRILTTAEFNGQRLFNSADASYQSSVTFQIGANNGTDYQIAVSGVALLQNATMSGIYANTSVGTATAAQSALDNADAALDLINNTRATFGAVQNRFESVIRNIGDQIEALSATRSRIRDADFAVETSELTRAQILQQAGIAMLSQANSIPQSVLSLLG